MVAYNTYVSAGLGHAHLVAAAGSPVIVRFASSGLVGGTHYRLLHIHVQCELSSVRSHNLHISAVDNTRLLTDDAKAIIWLYHHAHESKQEGFNM